MTPNEQQQQIVQIVADYKKCVIGYDEAIAALMKLGYTETQADSELFAHPEIEDDIDR